MKLSLFPGLDPMYSSGITPTASNPSLVRLRDIQDYAWGSEWSLSHIPFCCVREQIGFAKSNELQV